MKVRYHGESDPLQLMDGKEYEVIGVSGGYYSVIDEMDDDYMYDPEDFDIVEGQLDVTSLSDDELEFVGDLLGMSADEIRNASEDTADDIMNKLVRILIEESDDGDYDTATEISNMIGLAIYD